MFWGITPALDLQEEIKTNGKIPGEINILIVGGLDCRHVLKTLARSYRHENVKINFYLMEAILEATARQLLLLNIALQSEKELGPIQKARYFMELYGNTLIRPAVAKHLKLKAMELVDMITDLDYMKRIIPYVQLDLQYKERDYLENLFKFWCSVDEFNICEYWDKRVRKHLGIRYDTKMGAFEWDLHMRFHSVGGLQVCPQEYKHWRATGVAFVWLESEASRTNRSMVSGVLSNGEKFAHHGYLGDIQTGPFVSYGLDCEDPEFLRRSNGLNSQRATDVTERNLLQIFHEMQARKEYVHRKTNDLNLGSSTLIQQEAKVVDTGAIGDVVRRKELGECIRLENATINFVTINKLKLYKHKQQFQNFFSLIYFGSTYLKYFEGDTISKISAENSLLIIENQIFVVSYRDKQLEEFEKSLEETLKPIESSLARIPFDVKKDCYARFVLNSGNEANV